MDSASVVLICARNTIELVAAFLGVQHAGFVPALVAPKGNAWATFEERVTKFLMASQATTVLLDASHTVEDVLRLQSALRAARPTVSVRHIAEVSAQGAAMSTLAHTAGSELAFIQFTSGSVLEPRGVAIKHSNVEANCLGMAKVHGWSREDVCLTWLPLYHDMGLVGHFASALIVGSSLVLSDPATFRKRPVSWLKNITAYRATISAAPHFAYALCAIQIADHHLTGIDLSSWKHAYNGGEPIRRNDLQRFIARFQPYGFNPSAIHPVYGLAETTLAATFPPLREFVSLNADPDALAAMRYRPARDPERTVPVLSVGAPLPGHEIRIESVDCPGQVLAEHEVGHIQIRGPSVAAGYVPADGESTLSFEGWLNTGDLGFVADGELYICGRLKDTIKKSGRNIFASDVEALALQSGIVAAAVAFEFTHGTEPALGLAAEIHRDSSPEAIASINRRIVDVLGVAVDAIWIISRHDIPKTTSGKPQRRKARMLAESGAWGLALGQVDIPASIKLRVS